MQFNSPMARAVQPRFHEGSAMRSVRDSDANSKMWQKNRDIGKAVNSVMQATEQNTKQIQKLKRRIVGGGAGGAGWDWMYPTHKELDPSLPYSSGKVAFISPLNPIVTDGLMDLVSSAATMAGPGTWLCVKDCPPATWDDPLDYSSGTWNVPQIPYPGAGGTPSGTPLKGDIDGANVFWVLVTPICP